MINTVMFVMIGGAVGALLREFLMLTVGTGPDGFPLDIFTANVVASFLLGLGFSLHRRKLLNDGLYVLIGTGVMGGLSTFSSFVLAAVQLMDRTGPGPLSSVLYVGLSLAVGFGAVILGLRAGNLGAAPADREP
ncbi:CrcB family protein [Thiocapsa rosea]|uniref:Fluoride-specific ion channel FluC n=1 Tax=Thiocapsa rosea TaxID=69360 RepID=A0A495VDB1_9GAMM|nr:CrcB family protein [Thiocapsa rosea]RKT47352.1 camphor resistance protein CrcB [Thiocapsa rosea]